MTSYINTTSFADAQTGTTSNSNIKLRNVKLVFLNKKHRPTGMCLVCDILKIKILHWKPYYSSLKNNSHQTHRRTHTDKRTDFSNLAISPKRSEVNKLAIMVIKGNTVTYSDRNAISSHCCIV